MKTLILSDINDYINDNQKVKIVAYNIELYRGDCGNIPVKFSKYELIPQKIHVEQGEIIIELDC